MQTPDKGKIAKNTIILYIRMLFVMGVSLYTSRVILEILGVVDLGIYQTVGGVVGMLTFVNSALSNGTSRFITYELGRNNPFRLACTFSTIVNLQLLFIIIFTLAAETIGLWFVENKLQIPEDTYDAAIIVYHLSIVTTAVSLICVPYGATIISYERINVFAYLSIYEICSKLGIIYLLTVSDINRLVLYAILVLLIQISLTAFHVLYCTRNFKECRYRPIFSRSVFKNVAGFSGWSLFAATSLALTNQGVLVLLNMFFSPVVVTARTISLQVNNAANQFVSNFRTAVNPQIVKQYAAGNFSESKDLLLSSTKFSYYMMFLLSLPICIGANDLLHVWLTEVPDYTVIFLQLVVVQSLFQVFDSSFYIALYAKGDLKLNALISPTTGFLMFPIVYLLFRNGASPVALSWATLVCYAILGIIIKPILIIKVASYNWKEIWSVYQPCIIISCLAGGISALLCRRIPIDGTFLHLLATTIVCVVVSLVTIYVFGLDKTMKAKLMAKIGIFFQTALKQQPQ